MKGLNSVKDVCEVIFSLEAEHGLLDLEIDGVKLWQAMRMSICYRMTRACGVLDDPQPAPRSLWTRLRERSSNLKSALLHDPRRRSGPFDALVFDHPRSVRVDGAPVDIYTQPLLRELSLRGERALVIEPPHRGVHIRKPGPDRAHLDSVLLRDQVARRLGRYRCSGEGLRAIEWLATRVEDALPVALDLRPLLVDGLRRFHSDHEAYSELLDELQPKRIYVVVAYDGFGSLVKAARHRGVEVIELQHGVFSRYHLGYSFPDRREPLEYFPDRFFSWGRYWSELIDLPIPREDVVEKGFPHFHHMAHAHRTTSRQKNRVLVLSQGALGRALADRIHQHIDDLEGFEITYKLHPSEYTAWKRVPSLVEMARNGDVRVIDHNANLYQLFAESEYQIGAFSTAVYEGIGMGCRTVLLDLPGVEYMDRLLESGLAVLHQPRSDLGECLRATDSLNQRAGLEGLFGVSWPEEGAPSAPATVTAGGPS